MNARKLFTLVFTSIMLIFTTSQCAPAATPVTVASEPRGGSQNGSPSTSKPQTQQPLYAPQATRPVSPTTAYSSGNTFPNGSGALDNQFQDYGVNPQTDTRGDHLSTFALDVDTASYSVARRYILDGSLPPYDAVRVEEFVNSFSQGYKAPYDKAFTVYADGAPAPRGYYEGGYILRFGVQGYRVPDSQRKPSILTFVIDVSGSMNMEHRLDLVKQSLHLLVDRLDERDSVAIVVYSSSARVVLDPTNASRKDDILSVVDSLNPEDSTNAEAGLRLGYKIAIQSFRSGANNRVILCSDGVANSGNTDPEVILNEVAGYVDEGITLTAVGVGMGNFNDVLLEKLADKGNGTYAYVGTLDEARRLFVDQLTSTLQVIARDAKVQVDFNPDVVQSYRLLGYENRAVADQDFRNDAVDAGELGAGHSATALYWVALKPDSQGRIATVQLRWQDPEKGDVREINGNFNTFDLAGKFEEASPRYQLAVTLAQFAEVLRQSPYASELSLRDLANQARHLARKLDDDPQVTELADLIQRAAELK